MLRLLSIAALCLSLLAISACQKDADNETTQIGFHGNARPINARPQPTPSTTLPPDQGDHAAANSTPPPTTTVAPPADACPARRAGLSLWHAGAGQAGLRRQPLRAGIRSRGRARLRARARKCAIRTRTRFSSCPERDRHATAYLACFQRIAIFGPGLIGGSLALAARRRGLCARLSLWSRDAAEREAVPAAGDWPTSSRTTPPRPSRGADLVLLCMPPAAHGRPRRANRPAPEAGRRRQRRGQRQGGRGRGNSARFSAPSGWQPLRRRAPHGRRASAAACDAARADLFEGAVCLLTPDERTAPDALATVDAFWQGFGARVRRSRPPRTTRAVALVSHLPHVLAAALVDFVRAQPGERRRLRRAGLARHDADRRRDRRNYGQKS